MTCKERVLTTLQHKEPDRVPFDLDGTTVTGIHRIAYRNLLSHIGMDKKKGIEIYDPVTQQAEVDEDVLKKLEVDIRKVGPGGTTMGELEIKEEGKYKCFTDGFGIKWCMPKEGGLYYDMRGHPLSGSITLDDVKEYTLPDFPDIDLLKSIREQAEKLSEKTDFAFTLVGSGSGIFEYASWIRGYKDFYLDLLRNPPLAESLLDKITDYKIRLWEILLDQLGNLAIVAQEADDLGTQDSLLVSPDTYRKLIKPKHKRLFKFIKQHAPKPMYVFLHSDGAIFDLIPDLIEIGVDILNPVQVSAAKMDTRRLKREFGDELVFWGGGIDTQHVLPNGTPNEIRDEVKRRIDDLAPGGGFIFATVHNIQADVPPANIMAMWEALQEYGGY